MPAVYEKHKNTPVIEALADAINQYEHEETRDLAKFVQELAKVVVDILEDVEILEDDLGGDEEDG